MVSALPVVQVTYMSIEETYLIIQTLFFDMISLHRNSNKKVVRSDLIISLSERYEVPKKIVFRFIA